MKRLLKLGLVLSVILLQPLAGALAVDKTGQMSTIDFVQVLNKNRQEALFYYQNNWLKLRKQAKAQGLIQSFTLLELTEDSAPSFDLMLITTYENPTQFAQREDNFQKLIDLAGKPVLKNQIKPADFRKVVLSSGAAQHIR